MRNSGRPKREPYQRRRRRNLVVVAFRVKIGLSSSISAGRVGAFVCLVRESLWGRFEAPPLSPAGGRTECAARDASCRRSEHASSTQCAVRPLARLDRRRRSRAQELRAAKRAAQRDVVLVRDVAMWLSRVALLPRTASYGPKSSHQLSRISAWPRLRPRTMAALRRQRPSL